MKKRWFNFRPLCVIFMFLLLGTLFAFYLTNYKTLCIIIASVIIVAACVIAIIFKKVSFVILPVVSFIIGYSAYSISIYNYTNITTYEEVGVVQARIYQTSTADDGRMTVYADSVYFDGEKIDANIIIYIYDSTNVFENIEVGSVIEFEPFGIYTIDLFYNEIPNAKYYENNIKYSLLTSSVTYIETDKTLAEIIKEKIKENLSLGLNNENTEIAYSTLFGDKTNLNNDIQEAFQLSGIAHILAVSGLHVNIIVGVLYALLGFCRLKGWKRVIIIGIILLFYAYICDFSVSIIRAVIMSLLLMIAPLVGRKYDTLNAISLAGIVIFVFNPLCVFNVSFLMSFSCVLGIAFISRPLSKVLLKIKAPKYLAETLAVCCSTCLSLIFIQVYFFGKINLISIIANLMLIPLFTLAFEIIFCIAFLSLIIPQICYLLLPINYILNFISVVALYISNLSFANIQTLSYNYITIVVYFYLLMLLGRFCTASNTTKTMITFPVVVLLLAIIV